MSGTKEFEDYYRVGSPGDYWFGVEIISPNRISGKTFSKVRCYKKKLKRVLGITGRKSTG